MATTYTIQQTVNWVAAFIVQRPQSGVGNIANEPALTTANKIIASILAAPFAWSWNRKVLPAAITTAIGTQDYAISLSDFGWLEKAVAFNANSVPPSFELDIYVNIGTDTKVNRPRIITVHIDDNAGNITFRLFPVPDQIYTITLTYQKAPVLATSLTGATGTWAPIPDKYSFLYEQGMLAHMQGIYSIPAYLQGMQFFFRQLIGAAEGLTETQRAIFLEDSIRQLQTSAMAQQAVQGSPKRS